MAIIRLDISYGLTAIGAGQGLNANSLVRLVTSLLAVAAVAPTIRHTPAIGEFGRIEFLFVPLGATVFGIFIEMAIVGYKDSSLRQIFLAHDDQSTGYDVFFFILVLLGIWSWLPIYFSFGIFYLSESFQTGVVGIADAFGTRMSTGSLWGDLALFIVVWSFFDYWNHRILHFYPFWYLHRMHHSATNMTLFTAPRNNPMSFVVEPFIRAWPFVILAPDPYALLIFGTLNHSYQILAHSRIASDWGWIGSWVLVSPAAHRVHHSTNPDHYGKNLAVVTLWDRVFGTWIGSDHGTIETGVKESGHNAKSVLFDAYKDVFVFFSDVLRIATKSTRREDPS